jgi:hypothetical protein
MNLHRLGVDVRFECADIVRERWQLVWHRGVSPDKQFVGTTTSCGGAAIRDENADPKRAGVTKW